MDDTVALLARRIDHICGGGGKNIYNMSWNIDPANIYAPSAGACSAGAIHFTILAPDRLRLGIGPSHRFIVEGIYGLQQRTPLVALARICEIPAWPSGKGK